MGTASQTRWQRTRSDWRGFRGIRDTVNAAIGAAITAAVLLYLGFPHDAVVTGITLACAAVGSAIVMPLAELWWSWHKAPARLLQAEREENARLKGEATATQVAERDAEARDADAKLRSRLLDYKRQAEELYADYGPEPPRRSIQQWTSEVVNALTEHGLADRVEQFTSAGTGTAVHRFSARRFVLTEILDSMKSEKPAPSQAALSQPSATDT